MPTDPDLRLVKHRLRTARHGLKISQREATRRAGISQSVLEKYESRDNQRLPSTRQLFRLAEVYGVAIDYLLGRTESSSFTPSAPATNGSANGSEAAMAPAAMAAAAAQNAEEDSPGELLG